jgi:hypothetical protein
VAGDQPDLRLRDTIAVDLPYNDWIAEAYELFMYASAAAAKVSSPSPTRRRWAQSADNMRR